MGKGLHRPQGLRQQKELAKAYAHTLSLRLTAEQYRRLRRYVADQEEKTGRRVTHQAIIEEALAEYLTKMGG